MTTGITVLEHVMLILLTGLVSVGCTSTGSTRPSLEPLLPDTEVDSIRFFHGSWVWPDSIYAFQISESTLYVADHPGSRPEARRFSVDDCPMITGGFADLKSAIFETVRIASGETAVEKPSEIVVDGPDYRVEYWSGPASTTIILRGDSNSQLVSPWVDAALRVRAIEERCSDS